MTLRRIEENVIKNRESKAPTVDAIHAIDFSRRLELIEAACKVFAIPIEVKLVLSRITIFRHGLGRR